MSWKNIVIWGVAFIVTGSIAMAQESKIEAGVNIGYTLSEGVEVNQDYNAALVKKVNPTNGTSWGFNLDFLATENFAVGFLYDQQMNKLNLDLQGGGKIDLADNNTYNYHGVFTYNAGEEDSPIRPYFFGGVGATRFSGGKILLEAVPADASTSIGSETKFSTVWGGGVKFFPSKNIGFKFDARWTPTYIKTDAAGIWCGPYGCWVVGDTDYSNQFKMSAGIILRF